MQYLSETLAPPRRTAPDSAAGHSWLVWLRSRADEPPDPARTGLGRHREGHVLGGCLFVLPVDGTVYSWCHRDQRAALLSGHLINREELRSHLELPAHPPPTDAELLLAAYARWGHSAADELEGTYAAVIWDQAEDRLLCVRDALGLMPVFYAQSSSDLVISSDLWTLLKHPTVSREINRAVVAEHLVYRLSRVEETFFSAAKRLPGGFYLLAHDNALNVRRYWDPLPPPGEPINWLSRDEVERFPDLMSRAIRSYMGLGPAAVSLSSGLDSVSVAAFATEVAQETGWPRPHALSIHFPDPTCDESELQSAVAVSLNMPCRLMTFSECLGGRLELEALMALTASYPWPIDHVWAPMHTYLVHVADSLGIRVLLTGIGGDEWVGVSPLLAADLIAAGDLKGLWHLYLAYVRGFHLSPGAVARNLFWRCGLQRLLSALSCRYFPEWMARRRHRLNAPPPDWLAPDPELRRELDYRLQPPPPERPVEPFYLQEIRKVMQEPLVVLEMEQYYYRVRATGVSYFHPYLNRAVTEFLLRTPPRLLNDGGRAKGIIRRLLAERFPGLGFEKQKKVSMLDFFPQLVDEQWPGIWRRWAADSALVRMGIADARRFEAELHRAQPRHAGRMVMWLSTECWLRSR